VAGGLEDTAMMARFVGDYLGLLEGRVKAITHQLESGDHLTAHISLLSLESTSLMVGAKELAMIAGLLRGAVERGHRSTVPALVTAMTAEAAKVHDQFTPPS
jgi:molybdopterin-binding protein